MQVYGKLLEFYNAAFEMLTKKGAKLVMTLVLNNGRLPSIVSDFMIHAENLRKRVESATLEIVNEIKNMLFDVESESKLFHTNRHRPVADLSLLVARWLGSEKISRQGQHHAYLQELRSDQACEFLLKDDSFIKWYQATGRESRQLVILGNMGSGKSVSMAFLIDELRRRNEHQLPQPRICYHYCQNDGSGQAVYIFSSLILSLLEQLPGLKKGFFEWYKRTTASGINPATNFKELEEWLGGAMDGMDRHIFFAIDGLDECDRQSRNHVLKSFRKLTEKAPGLRVLLSSRPEEEIVEQLSGVSTIAMPSDAVRDRFIVEKTVEHRLCYLASDVKELVTDTLSRGAQGSAIWTKMTVDLIEVRGIKAFGPMKAFLDEIPQSGKLAELYTKLFSRYTLEDPESQRLATTALEVLAAARRPLSMLELAWAVTLDTAQEAVPDVDTLAKLVDHQRIMSLIQPFVVHVDFHDLKKRQVKLAHQSVKEFVINHWASHRPGSQSGDTPALPSTGQPLFQDRIESLEAGLLGICIKYLLLKPVDDVELFSEEYMAILELPQDPFVFTEDNEPNNYDHYCSWETWEEDMIHFDPTERGFGELFVYASCLWTEHFATIPAESLLSPLEDIERLCKAGSTRLRNWTTQNCRPDCAIRPRFDFDSTLYDPLGVTSIYGSTAMFQHLLGHSDFSKSSFLPNPAMAASDLILQNGDLMRIRPLWESKVGHQIKNGAFFHLALKRWASYTFQKSRPGWDMVFSLIDDVLDKMVNERWGNELLTMAVKSGCMPLIQLLLDRAQHHSELRTELLSEVRSANSLLGEAVLGDYVEILEYLLQQQGIEPQLQHSNSDGQNALHLASKHRNPTVYRLLAPRMREMIHQQDDNNGDTPVILLITSPSDRGDLYESVQILLSEAEESEAGWGEDEMHEAVRVAAAVGDKKMCHLLMSYGTPLFLKVRQTT